MVKKSMNKRASKLLLYAVVIAVGSLVAFPIYWLVICSVQPETALFSYPPNFFPKKFVLEGYVKLFLESEICTWIINTAFVTFTTAFLVALFSVLAGYSFSRFKYRGRNALSLLLLSTQMISSPMIITPLYIVFCKLGLINTYFSLIIADIGLGLAVATWLMKGFFDGIPIEIEEAAYIDGCGRLQILGHIMLPLCKTGLVTILVMTFFVTWNEYLYGLIFISDQGKWIGSVGLSSFIGSYIISQDQILAGATIFSIIPVLFFMFFQKHIVMGVTKGAIKG